MLFSARVSSTTWETTRRVLFLLILLLVLLFFLVVPGVSWARQQQDSRREAAGNVASRANRDLAGSFRVVPPARLPELVESSRRVKDWTNQRSVSRPLEAIGPQEGQK